LNERRYPYLTETDEFIVTERDRGVSRQALAEILHRSLTMVAHHEKRARGRIVEWERTPIPRQLTAAWPILWVDTPGDRMTPIRNPSAPDLELSLAQGEIHPGAIPGMGIVAVALLYYLFGHPEPIHPPYQQVLAESKNIDPR